MASSLKMGTVSPSPLMTPSSVYPPPYVRRLCPRAVPNSHVLRMPPIHLPNPAPKHKEICGFPTCVLKPESSKTQWKCHLRLGAMEEQIPSVTGIVQEAETLILSAANMNFFERVRLAWRILFPMSLSRMSLRNSNANIAKQRLKMILFSDRCAITEEAKQKIVSNIVSTLSDFVEIDSRDKVQLSVSADADLGTVYSVTVPVKCVRPEYRESEEEYTGIANIEYKDTGETSGSVDVRFDFVLPNE